MKITSLTLAVASTTTYVAARHPAVTVPAKFRAHLKCPYAEKWVQKGPEQAARELGLDGRSMRRLQAGLPDEVAGSCNFVNAFSGGMTCLQFNGAWTDEERTARCDTENDSFYSDGGCVAGDGEELGGWCTKDAGEGKVEATAMILSDMADCSGSEMACGSFMQGSFIAAGSCASSDAPAAAGGGPPTGVVADGGGPPPGVMTGGGAPPPGVMAGGDPSTGGKCILAPGAIGAAHQAGFSKGYSKTCPGAHAEGSPYMWPLKWAADYENHAMAYGSDDVVYNSRGRTFYSLDRNWKRSDTNYALGTLRTIGQGPCMDSIGTNSCLYNQTSEVTTMIHRENMMYFIDYKEDSDAVLGETDASKIANCSKLNLAVVGNIRPDWFLDSRGDDTDVQYLGDQHVFYDTKLPKLVKQWRKKDFASQYFVMSMRGNPPNYLAKDPDAPEIDDIHLPLILNIPGEGFGDDSIQVYRNHALLDEDDDDLFLLIENFEALGGVCVDPSDFEGGGVGPPSTDEHIPSNLEVDPLSWVSNEVTFSPVWVNTKEVSSTMDKEVETSTSAKTVIEASERVTVEACLDEASMMIDYSIHYRDMIPAGDGTLPWVALGFRPTDRCAMNPLDGSPTPIVLVQHAAGDASPMAYSTDLVAAAKGMSEDAFAQIYMAAVPLDEAEGFSDVSIEAPTSLQIARSLVPDDDTLSVHFKHSVEDSSIQHLMFAIGMTNQLGFHTTRGCFEVKPVPCSSNTGSSLSAPSTESEKTVIEIELEGGSEAATIEPDAIEADAVPSVSLAMTAHPIAYPIAGLAASLVIAALL